MHKNPPEPIAVQIPSRPMSNLHVVKPFLDKRCAVVCHSCYNSSCQLKRSSYEGVDRGGSKLKVYNATRLSTMGPTRLLIFPSHSPRDQIPVMRILVFFSLFTLLCSTYMLPSGLADQANPHAVILMYHRFGEEKYPSTNITVEQFESQLQYLKDNDFSVLPLEDIVEAVKNRSALPDKTVAITIDDAYKSIYEVAYPRLKRFGFPFTVFVATGGVDKGIPAYMTWQHMKEMQDGGTVFANHTEGHDYLIRKKENESHAEWEERITASIKSAQDRIMQELGQAPMLFAYPYGEYNSDVAAIVDKLGYTAFGQHSGAVGILSDTRALPRFPMAESFADMDSFKIKVDSLPMPVIQQEPVNPQTTEKRPQLSVTLAPSNGNLRQLACYNGSKRMAITWLEPDEKFSIQAHEDLPPGRSRYNCTAPDRDGGRYYWFSHQWILPFNE